MSSRVQSKSTDTLPLGAWLRQLRHSRELPIRVVATAADMDTAHLSKIELGQRLPTEDQTRALARFFKQPTEDFAAKRIAEKFWQDHRNEPAAHKALSLMRKTTRTKKRTSP